MKFILSDVFSAGDINLAGITRSVVIGAVSITAIVRCGILAFLIIAAVYLIVKILDHEAKSEAAREAHWRAEWGIK